MQQAATFTHKATGKRLEIIAAGEWTVVNSGNIEKALQVFPAAAGKAASVVIDMAGVTGFDSYGAWLVERLRREFVAAGARVAIKAMQASYMPLLDEMTSVNLQAPVLPAQLSVPGRVSAMLAKGLDAAANDISAFTVLTGAVILALGRILAKPGSFRLTSTVNQFDRVGWRAVPIIMMITFLIGAIVAQQGFFHFRRFGADLYIIDMVGFLVMRELGVLLVAIMVAGRTGSAFTAELGSMKMREEIDALRTMGFDPVDILILPRLLVLVLALPVLAFIGSMAALFGAGMVGVMYGGMSVELFMDRLRESITMDHLLVGLIKAPFMGFFIGIIACHEGLAVSGSAASLGQHTTQSVVKSIFMVIVLDGLFAVFFSVIAM